MTVFCTPGTTNNSLRYADYAEGRLVKVEFDGAEDPSSAMLLWFEGYDKPVRKPARWVPDFELNDESYYVATWRVQATRDAQGYIVPRRRFVFVALGDYDDVVAQLDAE